MYRRALTDGQLTHPLALLLLHDQLFNKSGIATSSGPLKDAILRHKARLAGEFTQARLRRGFGDLSSLLAATIASELETAIPRWVRVNTLKFASSAALLESHFKEYTVSPTLAALMVPGAKNIVYIDAYIPNLLGFPPNTNLTTHPLYLSGALILQDRSSCIPAHFLSPPANAYTIDATSAPGNKTSHLAAIHHSLDPRPPTHQRIFAYEQSPARTKTLQKMLTRASALKIVEIRGEQDFLKADPKKDASLKKVTHIMLDPSCSGSGIVSRKEYTLTLPPAAPAPAASTKYKKRKRPTPAPAAPAPTKIVAEEEEPEEAEEIVGEGFTKSRLLALGEFQKAMILHAMKFPAAQRISYSTCSVHREENEDVVMAVLGAEVARKRGWRVLRRDEGGMRDWERRGVGEGEGVTKEVAEACVRCVPVVDGGIGFFCVVFVREEGAAVETEADAEIEAEVETEVGEEEWKGFSEEEPEEVVVKQPAKKKKKKAQKQKSAAAKA